MKITQIGSRLNSDSWRKKTIVFVFLLFVAYTARYVTYLMIAGATVPIMDYWRWIYKFGPTTLNNDFSLSLFYGDGGEHSQAGTLFLVFKILVNHKFDMKVLLYYGAILIPVLVFIHMVEFVNRNRDLNWWGLLLGGCLTFVILLSYNAWEIYTENFIFTSALGTLVKYALYRAIEGFLRKTEEWSDRKCAVICSAFCVAFTMYCLWFSAVSFIGNVIVLAFVTFVWAREDKKYKKPSIRRVCIAIAATCVLIIVLYFALAKKAGGQSVTNTLVLVPVFEYVKGYIIGLGASILPNTVLNDHGRPIFYVTGSLLLIWVVLVVVLIIKKKLLRGNILPLMYLVSGGVMLAVACFGRIGQYGVSVMTSSRYCVYSNTALIGLIWLTCQVFKEKSSGSGRNIMMTISKCVLAMGCVVLTLALLYAAKIEWGIAPYRGQYYSELARMMRKIDEYSDSQLGGFQSDATFVRGAVEFLRNNHLSIFR